MQNFKNFDNFSHTTFKIQCKAKCYDWLTRKRLPYAKIFLMFPRNCQEKKIRDIHQPTFTDCKQTNKQTNKQTKNETGKMDLQK